jgi:hypothetical protein
VRVAVAIPAFLADSRCWRFPDVPQSRRRAIAASAPTPSRSAGTELVARGTASVPAGQRGGGLDSGAGASLRVDGPRFEGRFTPARGGVWRPALAAADGAPVEGELPTLALRIVPDSAPIVAVLVPGRDTTLPLSPVQPLVIDVRDDHGITRLALVVGA